MKDWVKVFEASDLATASMVLGILIENEIPAQTLDKKDSAFVFLGKVEVVVPSTFEATALALIQNINFEM